VKDQMKNENDMKDQMKSDVKNQMKVEKNRKSTNEKK
jgi:uncharacterized membrane protein required for colicin V production